MNLAELVALRARAEAAQVEGMDVDSWPCAQHHYRDALQDSALELFEARAVLDELERMETERRLEREYCDGALVRTFWILAWSPHAFQVLDVARQRSARKLQDLLAQKGAVQ